MREREGRRASPLGQRATPTDGQRLGHLGERQLLAIPGEGGAGILRRLTAAFLLERRILGSPVKEVLERGVQVPQGLLRRDTGDLLEKGHRFLLLQGGQGRRGLFVEEMFPALAIGIASQSEPPIIDKTHTTKRPGQPVSLAWCRIAAVPIGMFLVHASLFFFTQAKPASERRARLLPIT